VEENKYNIIQPLLLAIILAIGMLFGYRLNEGSKDKLINKVDSRTAFKSIEEVMNLIDNRYLYKTNNDNFVDKAMSSVVNKLDPFSKYIKSSQYESVTEKLEGHFTGLGIGSMIHKDTMYVINVIKNSPAFKAGIKTMFKIVKIGNVNIAGNGKSTKEVRNLILKFKNKDLDLTIIDRNNIKKPLTVRINKVENNTISKAFVLDDSTVFIGINQFSNHTYREFMETLENYVSDNSIDKLIIDLRNNPGGYLQEVTKILDQFFDESKLPLVKTVYKDGREDIIKTSGRNFYNLKKVLVLINSNSASASEVFAGVIQDYDRGIIIGHQSFGKGLVQEQFQLKNGGAIRLTIANYFLPSGRSIQRKLNLDTAFVSTKDSHYEKQDTFYSKDKIRPLLSNMGINPDFEVQDSSFNEMDYLFWEFDSLFLSWSLNYIDENKDLFNLKANEFINDYSVKIDSLYFVDKINKPFLKNDLFSKFLKSKLAFVLFDKNIEAKVLSKFDPYIKEAIIRLD